MTKYLLNWKTAILVFLLLTLFVGILFYSAFFAPNLNVNGNKKQYVFVYPNQTWNDVLLSLEESDIISCSMSYKMAVALKYSSTPPQTGKYDIESNLSNRYLLNRITHGLQSRIILRLVSARATSTVARNLCNQVMIDSTSLMERFHNPTLLDKYHLTTSNSLCLFLPFTKETTWDIHIDEVMLLIESEYEQFWNEKRRKLAKNINLSPAEVHILASIVEEETNNYEDKKMVAGLYLFIRDLWAKKKDAE